MMFSADVQDLSCATSIILKRIDRIIVDCWNNIMLITIFISPGKLVCNRNLCFRLFGKGNPYCIAESIFE